MKTVVITGSARGLGFEMAKVFRRNNVNVVISDLNEEKLQKAKRDLEDIESSSKVEYMVCNVTKTEDILKALADAGFKKIKIVDRNLCPIEENEISNQTRLHILAEK